MVRIPPLEYEEASKEMQPAYEKQIQDHGRMTHMKKTLAHAPVAFHALMSWYPLFEEVKKTVGERPTILFAHAISSQTDCLICSTFFRRIVREWGEDPDHLQLNEHEQILVRYGRQLVLDANQVHDDIYAPLEGFLSSQDIVHLTAFGGIMIATNVFNNALRVPLDPYLFPYAIQKDSHSSSDTEVQS